MINAVLFDMDGVLIDSEMAYMDGTWVWMKEMGYKGSFESLFPVIGTTMEGTYQMLYEILEKKIPLDTIIATNERYFKENPLNYQAILKDDAIEVLQELKKRGMKIALCSSSSQEVIEKVVSDCDIETYFDFIVSGEQFRESKPNPEIYLHASEVLNVSPANCLVIEDSSFGIEAGVRAKMAVLAVVDERFSHSQEKATKKIHQLKEIIEWIELQG